MKNSIKTLTILLVSILVSNVAKAAVYSLSYSGSTATWKNSSGTTISAPTLSSSDSVTLTAGTWTLSGSISVGGVRLNSGTTLALSSRTLTGRVTVPANATITAATSGTIGKVTGTVFVTGGTLTVSNSTTFSNLVLSGGSISSSSRNITTPVSVSANATITATGTYGNITVTGGKLTVVGNMTYSRLTLNGGSAEIGSYDPTGPVTISQTATLTFASGGTIDALTISSGTLTIAGSNVGISSLSLSGGNLNLASFIVTSSGDVTVTANGTISSSGSGILVHSNTTIINGGNLTLDNAELINDDLTFSSDNDIITTNNGLLSFDNSNNTITGGGTNRHVNGSIRVYLDNGNKNTAIYPLGNGTVYAPVRLEIPSSNSSLSNVSGNYGTHYFTLTFFDQKNNNTSYDNSTLPGGVSGHEYWTITSSSTNPVAIFSLYLNTTGTNYSKTVLLNNSNVSTDIVLSQYDANTSKWILLSSSVQTAVNGGVPVLTSNAMTPNTSFTFGSNNSRTGFVTPLPVSLIDFSAKANANNIEVKWSTASEKDNAAFVVEKSIDGQVWSAIGTVKGAKTSNIVNNYGLVDFKAVAGFQYYRLKQIDVDGAVNYSKAIAVNFSKASTLNVNLFPNPAKEALNITTENNATGEVNIQILNSMGETVYNQVFEAGLVQTIDIASFIPGVYYVTVIAEGESKIIRLLKN